MPDSIYDQSAGSVVESDGRRNQDWCIAMAIHRDRMLDIRATAPFMLRSPLAYDFALLLFRPPSETTTIGMQSWLNQFTNAAPGQFDWTKSVSEGPFKLYGALYKQMLAGAARQLQIQADYVGRLAECKDPGGGARRPERVGAEIRRVLRRERTADRDGNGPGCSAGFSIRRLS
ncbi:MAG: hypothetical protein B7Z15_06505 [Rhizobiales bacterium 32-66-8]|nr:MAG: hypothetical protein B7Z15_06505 [Rhizobiales bacterium 32-66-8]